MKELMKKIIALLMAGILLMAAAAFAEEVPLQVADPDAWNDEVIDGGWGVASDPAVTDEMKALFDKAMEGLVGVNYVPVAYLGTKVVAGYDHAILCQATPVYPGAAAHWVILYLFEDLDGGVKISDISDLIL